MWKKKCELPPPRPGVTPGFGEPMAPRKFWMMSAGTLARVPPAVTQRARAEDQSEGELTN